MEQYFESLAHFQKKGGLKQTTITAKQLLPAIVTHIQRLDRKFTLYVNGRLPKSMTELIADVFSLLHLQQPFFTQHVATQHSKYMNVSKNRVKIEFTMRYRMTREQHQWVTSEIKEVLKKIIEPQMTILEKIVVVHDYIVKNHQYEMNTGGSPFTVYTFMHEKKGVCMAYALLFQKMLDELEIPCHYVIGKADGESDLGHAWNMVQLEDKWYHIDATWNDLGSRFEQFSIRYKYFLRSDAFMANDHSWNKNHYPVCSSEEYVSLSNVFNATYGQGHLYYPHNKTGYLMRYSLQKQQIEQALEKQIQQCNFFDGQLYVSAVEEGHKLAIVNFTDKILEVVAQVAVKKIQATNEKMVVYYQDDSMQEWTVQQLENTEGESLVDFQEVPLMSLGDSWIGTYEGAATSIRFTSVDGLVIEMVEKCSQLTVDLYRGKDFEVNVTANRRPIKLQHPFLLKVPNSLIQSNHWRCLSGTPIDVKYLEEESLLYLNKSETLIHR